MTAVAERVIGFDDLTEQEWINALKYWRSNPMAYVDDMLLPNLKATLTDSQREVLSAIFKYKKVLIPTHHAFGKSFICAIAAITISNLFCNDVKGTTIAPTFRQVQDILWAEMRSIFEKVNNNAERKLLDGKMLMTRYDISAKAFVVGISPRKETKGAKTPEFIQGTHGVVVFVIGDEAGGLESQIYEQIEGITNTGGDSYIIYIGNPLNRNSEFGQMCLTEKGEGFHIIHKKAYDSPNLIANNLTSIAAIRKEADKIRKLERDKRMAYYDNKHYKLPTPYLLSPGWVMKSYIKWGESPLFFSKAIGEWVETTENVLVPLSRAEECMHGTYKDENGDTCWLSEESGYAKWDNITTLYSGIDCSGEGADKNVLFTLEGNRQYYHKVFSKTYIKNAVDFTGTKMQEDGYYIAKHYFDNVIAPNPNRKHFCLIDCTGGFGNTIYDALMKLPLNSAMVKVHKINFASAANDKELYHDIIAEMAFELANQINSQEGLLLAQNDDLKNQITNRKKCVDAKMRNMIESKADYKQRSGSSPDDFDALMLANHGKHITAAKSDFADAVKRAAKLQGAYNYGKDNY